MPRAMFTARQLREVAQLHPTLLDILVHLVETWPVPQLIVTSIARTPEENRKAKAKTTIHSAGPPWRAVDLRIVNLATEDYQAKAQAIAGRLNRRWIYDHERPKLNVAFARSHGTGPHIHLQVHPNTVKTELRLREET